MASRNVSIVLTGNNASALKALAGVEAAAAKAGTGAAAKMQASSSKIGSSFAAVDRQLGSFGLPFSGALTAIGTRLDRSSGQAKSFGGALSKIGAVQAAVGVGILAAGFTSFVREARESEKVTRLTNAVLKSTGSAAGVTASEVEHLANSLSKKSGIDDEVIQSGANVLLTFTAVRNEIGKGNNIFDQATTAALNMSAALGGDLQSNIIRIGKALQDPLGGLTALKKVGVNVDELKPKVERLVAAGDKLGAQRAILAELATEFGGAAEAAADPLQKLDVAIKNVEESIGLALLPKINSSIDAAEKAGGAFQGFNRDLGGIPGKILAVGAAVPVAVFAYGKLADIGGKVIGSFSKIGEGVGRVSEAIGKMRGVTEASTVAEEASAIARTENAAATATLATSETAAAGAAGELAVAQGTAATTNATLATSEAVAAGAAGDLAVAEGAAVVATGELVTIEGVAVGTTGELAVAEGAAAVAGAELAASQKLVGVSSLTAAGGLAKIVPVLTAIAGGFLAGKFAGSKLNDLLGGSAPEVNELSRSFQNLADTHRVSGTAASSFGDHLQLLARDLKTVKGNVFDKKFGFSGDAHAAVADIKSVNAALIDVLKTQGFKPAFSAFVELRDRLTALGVPIETINSEFSPFMKVMADSLPKAAKTSAVAMGSLGVEMESLKGRVQAQADAWTNLTTAITNNADSQRAQHESLVGVLSASINLQQGLTDVAEKQAAYNAFVKFGTQNTKEGIKAFQDLQLAQLSQAGSLDQAVDSAAKFADGQSHLTDELKKQADEQKDLAKVTTDFSAGKASAAELAAAQHDVTKATQDVSAAQRTQRDAILAVAATVKGPLHDALIKYAGDIANVPEKKTTELSLLGVTSSTSTLKSYKDGVDKVPTKVATHVSISGTDDALHQLGLLKLAVAAINPNVSLSAVVRANAGGRAMGGYVAPGQTVDVGELGKERLTLFPGGGGYVTSHAQLVDDEKKQQVAEKAAKVIATAELKLPKKVDEPVEPTKVPVATEAKPPTEKKVAPKVVPVKAVAPVVAKPAEAKPAPAAIPKKAVPAARTVEPASAPVRKTVPVAAAKVVQPAKVTAPVEPAKTPPVAQKAAVSAPSEKKVAAAVAPAAKSVPAAKVPEPKASPIAKAVKPETAKAPAAKAVPKAFAKATPPIAVAKPSPAAVPEKPKAVTAPPAKAAVVEPIRPRAAKAVEPKPAPIAARKVEPKKPTAQPLVAARPQPKAEPEKRAVPVKETAPTKPTPLAKVAPEPKIAAKAQPLPAKVATVTPVSVSASPKTAKLPVPVAVQTVSPKTVTVSTPPAVSGVAPRREVAQKVSPAPKAPAATEPKTPVAVRPTAPQSTSRTLPAPVPAAARAPSQPLPVSSAARAPQAALAATPRPAAAQRLSQAQNVKVTVPVSVTGTSARGPVTVAQAKVAPTRDRGPSAVRVTVGAAPRGGAVNVNMKFDINVKGGVATHPAEFGRAVHEGLNAFVRSGEISREVRAAFKPR